MSRKLPFLCHALNVPESRVLRNQPVTSQNRNYLKPTDACNLWTRARLRLLPAESARPHTGWFVIIWLLETGCRIAVRIIAKRFRAVRLGNAGSITTAGRHPPYDPHRRGVGFRGMESTAAPL